MVEAPERIWLFAADEDNEREVWTDPDEGGTEYVRADIATSQIAEARASAERQWAGWVKEEALRKDDEAERDRLAAEVTRLKEALREHVTENVWNAYHIGIERDGRWMDGARSEGEWLARELELPDGWNDAALVKSMLPGLVDRIVARAAIRAMEVKHDA